MIGHRGAPGYRPEHTLASYRLALAQGADAVEPDLVLTADGVAVLRHESDLTRTTDIAVRADFADRPWRVEALTLAELKSLRATERWPARRPGSARFDGYFEVATLDELLLLLADESRRRGRRVGLNAELKSCELPAEAQRLEDTVLASLRDHGLDHVHAGVVLQSFDPLSVRRLRERTPLPLVQLVEGAGSPLLTPAGLAEVATYADVLALDVPALLARPGLVGPAHRAGLGVLAYTVRHDDPDGPAAVAGRVQALVEAGVDGLFSDQPDQTLAVCAAYAGSTSTSLGTIAQAAR
ncbi:glycerophosphodiester phosphodiesterase [Nocardioides anomalus]|uniref:Glycerophosphodiester phosphodiesterase n=1 Tax=Nocardioides anomalus TaxID=2712223 RepID=A0A6G6WG97_9ACTN|nr:glycerophosphodiester phosphodiesterase family protein [Nocardioides anomalus]QIG44183.1 glycerophosphodiester phosphodiesterase [Nocardioides anomalus]